MNAILHRPEVDLSQLPMILLDSEPDALEPERFQVTNLEKALWATAKIAHAQKILSEIQEKAGYFRSLIDAWETKSSQTHLDTVTFLSSLLRPFLKDRLTGMKTRSIHLPGYRLGLRTSPPRVAVDDSELAIGYLESTHPETIQIKREVVKSVLKPILAGGELVPGASLVPGEETLYVTEDA